MLNYIESIEKTYSCKKITSRQRQAQLQPRFVATPSALPQLRRYDKKNI